MIKKLLRSGTLHKPFLFFVVLLFSTNIFAQLFPAKNYTKGYFIYPVDARIGLAANFGELRPNHYHMGLDCRTDQVVNRPVKAAADGYVSRISVAPFGFGRAIYINHPNGLTTLYGHLNTFYPALEKYLEEQQYQKESWAVSLELKPGQFPVKQGQDIGLSGSTGGSMGPHVHFEIRDTKTDKVLNPMLFGLPIPDNVPPTIVRLYMYDRCISTYSQTPKQLPIKGAGAHYSTLSTVIPVNTDKISFGISAHDKQSGSNNPNGIYSAVIYLDGKALSGFQLDSISYDETRYLNAHIDYKTKAGGGPYIEHLSRLPGYPQSVYKDFNGDGVIHLEDDLVHQIKIEVKDANGNTSNLNFNIKKGLINENGKADLKDFYKKLEFHPGFVNVFEDTDLQVFLSPEALYDSVLFTHSKKALTGANSYSGVHAVLSGLVPVQDYFTIKIKPDKVIPANLEDKILMKRTWGGKTEVAKATKEGELYTSKFKTFGNFELIADSLPPVIGGGFAHNANLESARSIVFTPTDNSDEIVNFRAELDGKWLRFTNDKGRNYIYSFDAKCGKGKHILKITVEDLAGNVGEKVLNFTR
ncbi:MAG: M23 family metallopeptidase [Ginsengibacter sp.]